MRQQSSRLVRPLPTNFQRFTDPLNLHFLEHSHPHQGYPSQISPARYHTDQSIYQHTSYLPNPTSRNVAFTLCGMTMSGAFGLDPSSINVHPKEWPGMPQYTTLWSSVNSFSAEYAISNNDRTECTMNFAYPDPANSTTDTTPSTTFRYDEGTINSAGMSGSSATVHVAYANPTHASTPHSSLAVPYPTFHTNLLHSQHSGVFTSYAPNPGYFSPSPYHGGNSFVTPQHWNAPVFTTIRRTIYPRSPRPASPTHPT
ncbi:hypothetical protein PM082_006253 [Marasmius tenuissimus]|nr:hypothetical protein PM082_006253 [Marasmius tenuissimus]